MVCPQCQFENPVGTTRCIKCSTPIEVATLFEPVEAATMFAPVESSAPSGSSEGATIAGDTAAWSQAAEAAGTPGTLGPIGPGSVVANRYEILKELGEGGMGAVYKAKDRELDRLVALKVIRPELARNAEILQRFKRELILARQITHRNVIRIFDLGVTGNIKFITMEYVEGQDLKSLLNHQKFTTLQTVDIMCQVCRGLEAAHAENVIHRDLKPQNIMLDQQGKVLVMDFGLAHSVEEHGMTQTGALMGTPDYMSPEQAKGEKADVRSDMFTLGIIFYELLAGRLPFKGESLLGTLLARTQQPARPVREINPDVPPVVSDIVSKCMAINAAERYQSVSELLADLEGWQTGVKGLTIRVPKGPRFRMVAPSTTWKWITLSVAGVAILLSPLAWYRLRSSGKPADPPLSLAIVPFRNASGDSSLDWVGASIAEMLSTDVGQSARLRTASPDRVYQILRDLRLTPESTLDPPTLRRVAEFSNAQTLVWGQYAKYGEQIRIDATLQDLKRDRTAPLKAEAPNASGIPGAVDRLAQAIRQNLALSASAVKELEAQAFKPSSKSLQALRDYNEGLQLKRQGKPLEAQKKFQAATKDDPEFALAYSHLAETYAELGYDDQAELASRKAVGLSANLPPQEKYRIAASNARIVKDYPKAIEAYGNLAKVSPDNADVQFALAGLYEDTGDFAKARQYCQKVLGTNPKDATALLAVGRIESKSGNPEASLDPLSRALSLAIQVDNQEQKALILQTMGIVYGQMNKPNEALQNYQQSLEIKRHLGNQKGIADSLTMIAEVYDGMAKSDLALKNYNEGLEIYRGLGDKQDVGNVLIDLGQFYVDRGKYDQGLQLFKEALQIEREVGNENYSALCLNNIGNTYLSKADYQSARTYFDQALRLREKFNVPADVAETVHNLAEVSTKMGQYDQALTEYLRALELRRKDGDKRGTAIESNSMGTLFEYQGRYGAAISSQEEALAALREAKGQGFWMASVLGGYGDALTQAGRFEDARKSLDEGLKQARELKNEALTAQLLNWQGDIFFYRGDLKSAKPLYEQALQLASKTTDRHVVVASKLNLAKLVVKEGRSQSAIQALQSLSAELDTLGEKSLSVESSIYQAEALIEAKDYSRAQPELERAVAKSEKLGLRTLSVKAHYLLANCLRLTNNGTEAALHYQEAIRLLDDIRKQPGAEKVLERVDLKSIYTESTRWAQSAKR